MNSLQTKSMHKLGVNISSLNAIPCDFYTLENENLVKNHKHLMKISNFKNYSFTFKPCKQTYSHLNIKDPTSPTILSVKNNIIKWNDPFGDCTIKIFLVIPFFINFYFLGTLFLSQQTKYSYFYK